MSILKKIAIPIVALSFIFTSCEEGPTMTKMNTEGENSEQNKAGDSDKKAKAVSNDYHIVVVNEILPTEKYLYLDVNEGDDKFWVAVGKQDIEIGGTYIFSGAIYKHNFKSKEYDRTFENLYMVNKLLKQNDDGGHTVVPSAKSETAVDPHSQPEQESNSSENIEREGSIKIADIVADPKKYEGKKIQVSGKCVKINNGIMGMNWIHLQDGSKDDYDFVVTTEFVLQVGQVVTMEAVVALNKDFGAGYKYDIILENGMLIELALN